MHIKPKDLISRINCRQPVFKRTPMSNIAAIQICIKIKQVNFINTISFRVPKIFRNGLQQTVNNSKAFNIMFHVNYTEGKIFIFSQSFRGSILNVSCGLDYVIYNFEFISALIS